MSEVTVGGADMPREAFAEVAYVGLEESLEFHKENPPNDDPYYAAHAHGVLNAATKPRVRDMLTEPLGYRGDLRRVYGTADWDLRIRLIDYQLQKALQKHLIGKPGFPENYTDHRHYEQAITAIADHGSVARAELTYDMVARRNQGSVAARYVGTLMLMQLYQDRLGTSPSVLDIGCGPGIGLSHIVRGGNYATRIVDEDERGLWRTDEDTTARLRALTALPRQHGAMVGVDLFPASATSKADLGWLVSCRFKPSELLDKGAPAEYEQQLKESPRYIRVVQGDAAQLPAGGFGGVQPDHQFDMVTLYTMLHQCSHRERVEILANAIRYASRTGFIVIQDFIEREQSSSGSLHFGNDLYEHDKLYNMYVLDMANVTTGFQHFATFESGRCRQMLFGASQLAMESLRRMRSIASERNA